MEGPLRGSAGSERHRATRKEKRERIKTKLHGT